MFNLPVYGVRNMPKSNLTTLSKYFPKGTNYFYGYPSGDVSGFLNNAHPSVEELVSARPLVCLGSNVNVITFESTIRPDIKNLINKNWGFSLARKKQIRIFPSNIDTEVVGSERNKHIKENLKK